MQKLLIVTGTEENRPLYWSIQMQPGNAVVRGVTLVDLIGWGIQGRLVRYFERLSATYNVHILILSAKQMSAEDSKATVETLAAIAPHVVSQSICLNTQPPLDFTSWIN